MSEKKFEVTYKESALEDFRFVLKENTIGCRVELFGQIYGLVRKRRYSDGVDDLFVKATGMVNELFQGLLNEKLKRLEPKEIVVHGYRPGRAVNSLSYTCPTCGAHIGKYPFCKYCGQALEIDN